MKKQIKFNGFIPSYRRKLKKLSGYSDSEYRLLDVYLHIADWDVKHKDGFGTTGESIRDIQKHYLPNWSVGKIQRDRKRLIAKEDLQELPDSKIKIVNYGQRISLDIQQAEQFYGKDEQPVPGDEQSVSSDEQAVQPMGQSTENDFHDIELKPSINTLNSTPPVQPNEQQEAPKETLNKPKQHQISDDDLIKKLVDRYGEDIKIPLKRWSPSQVWDAARITEARLNGGENIRNKIGCITNLCKEETRWEGSEWQERELKKKSAEEERRKNLQEASRPRTQEEQERINKKLQEMREQLRSKGFNF